MPVVVDPSVLLTGSLRLLCGGILLRSLQLLLNWRELSDGRLLGWEPRAHAADSRARRFRWMLGHPAGHLLLLLQTAAAAAGLGLPFDAPLLPWLVGLLAALQAWFNYRFARVYHASDTMFLIGLGAVFAGSLEPGNPTLGGAALLFLGVQAMLAYFMAGKSKILTAVWRDGSHLAEILRRSAFRLEAAGHWLATHRRFARGLAQGVIWLELLFPLGVVLPTPLFLALLAAGAALHAGIAFTMGLHGFFWSFVATYPALYFVHEQLTARLFG